MSYIKFMFVFVVIGLNVIFGAWNSISKTQDYMKLEPVNITATVDAQEKAFIMRTLKKPIYDRGLRISATITLPDGSEFHEKRPFPKNHMIDLIDGNTVHAHFNKENKVIKMKKPDLWELWKLTVAFGALFLACIVVRLQFYPGGPNNER